MTSYHCLFNASTDIRQYAFYDGKHVRMWNEQQQQSRENLNRNITKHRSNEEEDVQLAIALSMSEAAARGNENMNNNNKGNNEDDEMLLQMAISMSMSMAPQANENMKTIKRMEKMKNKTHSLISLIVFVNHFYLILLLLGCLCDGLLKKMRVSTSYLKSTG